MPLYSRKWAFPFPNGEPKPNQRNQSLLQTSFTRLSSGFRVRDPIDDRPLMDLSDGLMERLRAYRETLPASPPEGGAAPADLANVISRMRALAGEAASGTLPAAVNTELAALEAQIKEVVGRDDADEIGRVLDARVGQAHDTASTTGSASPATGSMVHRLMTAIGRARALAGNIAAATTPAHEMTRAEEQAVLSRAQALLEDGVSRLTSTPAHPRAKQLLN
jgi:hypothetical protein